MKLVTIVSITYHTDSPASTVNNVTLHTWPRKSNLGKKLGSTRPILDLLLSSQLFVSGLVVLLRIE